ncbi:bifunctional UDP-N-acetylglucosamine diphosphorylase/glucosamine-1-phosphate N-acetyltransferase GlmU [Prochlorococcus marinus]|uniref:bifunctional UDP-N-acetylglucosamine diphosphorylase/glucosamine-1-phosphate N-acetyltransferase GlmU n=1 Tax=Prochlorococcus marinus TaxID=1219 RepID=UPI0022B33485|nr:bifunctional UDP-N-acetylglucosamine diphosphorylase/glucosamine-1-phosphate N-acetyltransferase GlmU [Prochlorococcus marinus]
MLAIAILAAGKGTRMKSSNPKVLQELAGISLIERVLNTCKELNPEKLLIIIGHEAYKIKDKVGHFANIEFVYQQPQNGTGHAVQQLIPSLQGFDGDLLVLNGDVPLLKTNTIRKLILRHKQTNSSVSILTAKLPNPKGYGRVFTNSKGEVNKIVEDSDCTEIELENNLTNAGIYCFKWNQLKNVLSKLSDNNKQNEIYLTDTIKELPKSSHIEVEDLGEVYGINDKYQLSQCEELLQTQLKTYWMKQGVYFINPASSTISEHCKFGNNVIIEPQTHIRGYTTIGNNCRLGPNSFIENTSIGNNVSIFYSVVKDSILEHNVNIGPYSHIRPKTTIKSHCKIGNFVEIKKSDLGENTKINHLSYIGDTVTGKKVNIGAGTIVANFDGKDKHKTVIGNLTKTGANSVLIAPISVGNNVTIAGGSILTDNVPDNSLAIARSNQIIKKDWKSKPKNNQK